MQPFSPVYSLIMSGYPFGILTTSIYTGRKALSLIISRSLPITRKYSRSKIIVGGAGFSIYPKLLYETLEPDFGIYGEGEVSLHRLIGALETGQDYTGH